MLEGNGFSAKPSEKTDFIVKMTGPAMVRPASSDKWKAPLDKIERLSIAFTANAKRNIQVEKFST